MTHVFVYVPTHYPFDEICLTCGLLEAEGNHEGRAEYEEVPFCGCTNEELEAGGMCGDPRCPGRNS